jgi:zinc transport system substrate-binding protein
MDTHVWLDPVNAQAITRAAAAALADADPANAATYRENADAQVDALDALVAELDAMLAPVRDRPFVVFHDAYQYFEARFDLAGVGSITISPSVQPGAERIRDIRTLLESLDAACVFAEPQFEPALVDRLVEGTDAASGVLDPLGADLPAGPDLYATLLRQNAQAIRDCLS